MTKHRTSRLATAFSLGAQLNLATVAVSATLTTDDGKAILHVYGERLSFPEESARKIGFYANACQPDARGLGADLGSNLNLANWASNPKDAACFDGIFPSERTADVDHRSEVGTGLVLRFYPESVRFDPSFRSGAIRALPSTASVQIGLAGGIERPGCDGGTEPLPANEGWVRTHLYGSHPPVYAYVLPADVRLAPASRPLCVRCHETPSLAYACTINLTSPDHFAALDLTWLEEKFVGPDVSWKAYDLEARAMADSIFNHRPAGYLQ